MPFSRPTLQTLIDRVVADVETHLPDADPRLRRRMLNILARTLAGAAHHLYGHLDWLAKQVIFDTAEAEYLERWAAIWGIGRNPAAQATGSVTFTGTEGATVPAGSTVQRADGVEYTTDADGTISGGSASVAVTAVEAGADGDAAAASTLTLASPIAGVNSTATVAAGGITGGTDEESDDALRSRFLARIRMPPHGGTQADYEQWTKEVSGVTRAWCQPETPAVGQARILFARDDDADGPIPDAGEVTAVQTYIDAKKPVTADVTVVAPTQLDVDFDIALIPNTTEVQAAVQAELEDLILREGYPGNTLYISWIREAISIAAGEGNHTLTTPASDVVIAATELAVPGTFTWS